MGLKSGILHLRFSGKIPKQTSHPYYNNFDAFETLSENLLSRKLESSKLYEGRIERRISIEVVQLFFHCCVNSQGVVNFKPQIIIAKLYI